MRKKQRKLVITFETTVAAMAAEHYCKQRNAPGRLQCPVHPLRPAPQDL